MKIYAPNKQYNNISASVTFKNGVGETDNPRLIEWFREHGYTVEADEADETINDAADDTPDNKTIEDILFDNTDKADLTRQQLMQLVFDNIDKTDVDQLKAYAAQENINIGQSTSARGILQKIISAKKQEG